MFSCFGGVSGNPEKLVKGVEGALEVLVAIPVDDKDSCKKAAEDLSVKFIMMRDVVTGTKGKDPVAAKCERLSRLIIESHLVLKMIENLLKIDHENRNSLVTIISNFIRSDHSKFSSEYIKEDADSPKMVDLLMQNYENPVLALTCGSILREFFRIDTVAIAFLKSEHLVTFFKSLLVTQNFDVQSDAFQTIKHCLTNNKNLIADHMKPSGAYYASFSQSLNALLNSDNYATKRFTLVLLGTLLMDRINFEIMMEYINKIENLALIMGLIRLNSPPIQLEAFTVFKIFVANPNKPKQIENALLANKEKLIPFLETLLPEKEDEQFVTEKTLLLSTLKDLKPQ